LTATLERWLGTRCSEDAIERNCPGRTRAGIEHTVPIEVVQILIDRVIRRAVAYGPAAASPDAEARTTVTRSAIGDWRIAASSGSRVANVLGALVAVGAVDAFAEVGVFTDSGVALARKAAEVTRRAILARIVPA